MPELVINASNLISPLCYTVLKLEPYTSCPFKCVYCYSRWYIKSPTELVYSRPEALAAFRRFVLEVRRRGLRPIPFRLSTLVDPFPPHEQLYRFSERILRVALDYEYPLIINTKSAFYTYGPLRKCLEKLLDSRLAVLQVSISTFNSELAKILEPHAPDPAERIEAARDIGSTSAPLVLRLSPFIPVVSPTNIDEVEEFADFVREAGFKHVIVESLRLEGDSMKELLKRLGAPDVALEGYALREVGGVRPLQRISLKTLGETYLALSRELKRHGVTFATCKEGLFNFHTSDDCCGAHLLREYKVRLTLYDVYRYSIDYGLDLSDLSQLDEELRNISKACSRLYGDEVVLYPKPVSKTLRYHERKLIKVLANKAVLEHVAPHLANRLRPRPT